MNIVEIMPANTIYLIPDSGEHEENHEYSYMWCDNPAPDSDQNPDDAIKYIRADKLDELIKHARACCDFEMLTQLDDDIKNLDL